MNRVFPDHPAPRNVLIFRSELLPYSETFILSQSEKFQIFTPFYAGFRHLDGIKLPPARTLLRNNSKLVWKFRNRAADFGLIDPWFEQDVRRIQPELIHAHFEESGLKALPLAQRLKVPLFLTCRGYDVTLQGHRWQNWPVLGKYHRRRRSALFKKASLCFGVSRFICDQMIRRGYPPEKVRLHYNGVDTQLFRPDPTVSKRPKILFVGRLVEKKGCADLLHAMARVATKYPDVEVVIIGDGLLRESLEVLAREKKVNSRFCGVQSPQSVLQAMQESLLLCAPSVRSQSGDSEGLPNVVYEAQAVGLPVVGTRHAGIPEAVEHGVTGLLSGERDPDALAENILALLSNTNLRTCMGQAARARMLQHFDLKHQASLLEQIYLEAL